MPRRRDQEIKTWMSEAELQALYRRMDELGVRNRGAFIRKMALNGYCIHLDVPEIRTMTSLLRRCSNNLNQYAKKANQTGSIYEEDILDLKNRLDKIYDNTEKILERLNVLSL